MEADRQVAIQTVLSNARSGDAVLIAGKSRGNYQIFADSIVPFDDYAVARRWLRSRFPATAQCSA